MPPPATVFDRLIRKLECTSVLSAQDKAALRGLPVTVRAIAADSDLVSEGDRPSDCALVIEGFFCRYKILPNGGRQIFSFHVPGEVPDLQSLMLETMDHGLCALVPSQVGLIPHASINELIKQYPSLVGPLWRDTLIDAAIFREWLAGVGRRSAKQRIAHLFCELFLRYRSVGLAEDHGYELSLTQAELADALGLSTVHVNRVLQELRSDRLISTRGRFLCVEDWRALCAVGEFDPAYMHMNNIEA